MAKNAVLSEQVAAAIGAEIGEGRFRPGDKLPNEMVLAGELGVSRITLREGIRILCTQGVLEIRRGKGTFVISDAPASPAPGLDLSGASLRDLLEVRMALEPMAAWYAARRASEEELDRMEELLRAMEEAAVQGRPFLREERSLHDAIARASGNGMVRQLLPMLNKALYTDLTGSPESAAAALQDYREIVRCLTARSAEGARTFLQAHILHTARFAGQDLG